MYLVPVKYLGKYSAILKSIIKLYKLLNELSHLRLQYKMKFESEIPRLVDNTYYIKALYFSAREKIVCCMLSTISY